MSEVDERPDSDREQMSGEDDMLVQGTIAGSQDAATSLYRRHIARVFSYVLVRVNRNTAKAEDIAQEVFFDAWRNLSCFRQGCSFPAWLVGIAKRRLARYYRNTSRREEANSELVLDFLSSKATDAKLALEPEETAIAVTRALALLPNDYCELLMMKYRDGKSMSEISETLGNTLEAVNSRLQRARSAFEKALRETADTED